MLAKFLKRKIVIFECLLLFYKEFEIIYAFEIQTESFKDQLVCVGGS